MAGLVKPSPEIPPKPKDVVLIVEDEIQVRVLIAEYLRDAGFTVIEAVDASEAVAVLTSKTAVDIVFADVQMPGLMDGHMLARWIDEHCPAIPVLLTSGAPASQSDIRVTSGKNFIRKPYIYAHVEERLREMLGRERDRKQAR